MEREQLLDQIDFAQARIEEIEKVVINANPTEKGFKELVESYNKWIGEWNIGLLYLAADDNPYYTSKLVCSDNAILTTVGMQS